jgi:hypothetical protein
MSNQIIEKIKAEVVSFEEKKKAFITELKNDFPALFKEIFESAPKLKSFGWTQYTPYFNDGDTCEFGTNIDYLYINDCHEDDLDNQEDESKTIDIVLHLDKTLENEEDVRINNEVADKMGYTWYKTRNIGEKGLCYNPNYDAITGEAVAQIKEILSLIPEDFYKDLFGDHCKITVHSDGVLKEEEYDHD